MLTDKYKLCTIGMAEAGKSLVTKLEGYNIPDDFDPLDLSYNEIIANIRHQYTNYENILFELHLCVEYWDRGGYCPHDNEDGGCILISETHDNLKWAAKEIAKDSYQEWLERK